MTDTFASAPTFVPAVRSTGRRRFVAASSSFVFLTAAGAAQGGYFPGSWGWLTLAAGWAAIVVLVLDEAPAVSRSGVAFVSLLAAYALWTLASTLWSVDTTSTVLEGQRDLVYVATVLAALLVGRGSPGALLAGVWASATALCTYALATRLVPDRFGVFDPIAGYRLSEPIGYWNSLGMLAAIGALLALALASRAEGIALRVAAVGSIPLLATALYFTFSRGAWASLISAVVVLIVLDPRRLQALWWLAICAAAGVIAVALAVHEHALSTAGASFAAQTGEGHRLALLLGVVIVAAAAGAAGWAVLERRMARDASRLQRQAEMVLASAAAVVLIGFFGVAGAPWTVAADAWHGFASAPPASANTTLNGRLFHLSGSGRIVQWRVAWRELSHHPWVGSGGGTYERYWNLERPQGSKVRNVHNLYLEAAATLGVIGAAILIAAFGLPLVAAVLRRRQPLVPFAAAAFAGYLVHATADWDWQITAVTAPVLVCAGVCVASGREVAHRRALCVAAGALAAAGLFGIAMQTTLSNIDRATTVAAASRAARRASDVQPWSTDPWQRLGEFAISHRDYSVARSAIRRALAKDPGNWSLWLDLAKSSDGSTRANAIQHASTLNPKSPEIAAFRATLVSLSSIGSGPG